MDIFSLLISLPPPVHLLDRQKSAHPHETDTGNSGRNNKWAAIEEGRRLGGVIPASISLFPPWTKWQEMKVLSVAFNTWNGDVSPAKEEEEGKVFHLLLMLLTLQMYLMRT